MVGRNTTGLEVSSSYLQVDSGVTSRFLLDRFLSNKANKQDLCDLRDLVADGNYSSGVEITSRLLIFGNV